MDIFIGADFSYIFVIAIKRFDENVEALHKSVKL